MKLTPAQWFGDEISLKQNTRGWLQMTSKAVRMARLEKAKKLEQELFVWVVQKGNPVKVDGHEIKYRADLVLKDGEVTFTTLPELLSFLGYMAARGKVTKAHVKRC